MKGKWKEKIEWISNHIRLADGGEKIGARGFEPPTSCSRSRRANRAALRPDSN